MGEVVNIAAYKFVSLTDLPALKAEFRRACNELALRGTILLSGEGINLFLAGSRECIDHFLTIVRSHSPLADFQVKESLSDEQPFNRMLVKIKREIIAFGVPSVAPQARTSPKLPARQLKEWLDAGRQVRLLDVRNDYEVDLGTFQGAERLGMRNFREFPAASARLPERAKSEPLVMFCTGGIRCEKAGPLLEQMGFQEVYQLDGGILKYFEECGAAHYDGGCFVFDARVLLAPDLTPTGAVQCFQCQSVLTHEDIQSPNFEFGKSCPNCYRTPEEQRLGRLAQRQTELIRLAETQPGSTAYDNRRLMFVPRQCSGRTVLEFLRAYHPPTRDEAWQGWISDGTLTSRGNRVEASDIVGEGQQFEQLQLGVIEPAVATQLAIVYEDESLVVVDKPAPLPVHASGRYHRNTLLYLLSKVYRPEKLRVAHRLDANTTGLTVFCRKYASARVLQPLFGTESVDKRYLLRVSGWPPEDEFCCEAAISRQPSKVGSRSVTADGLFARTEFKVRERFADGSSLLEARTITGRTNQIRLHAWHLGFPIVGDPLYLPKGELGVQQTLAVGAKPMCLHAWQLRFPHPVTGQSMNFLSPLPLWCSLVPAADGIDFAVRARSSESAFFASHTASDGDGGDD